MLKRGLLVFVSLLFSVSCLAQGLEISVGQETAQARYSTNAGGTNYGRSELTYGSLFNSENKINLFEIGILVIDAAGTKAPHLEVGIGPKLYYIDFDCCRAGAIGLGGTLRYKLGGHSRFYISAKGYYAPSVVTFAQADSFYEAAVEFGFEVLANAEIYVGQRDIEVRFVKRAAIKVDDTSFFGMRIRF